MQIAITGSIATDHLMTFKGRFRDSLVVEQLDKVSLSFLADDLEVRRGGVAANIAFGMANLGQRPILVGAVGEDFGDYRSWLERHGVDCASVHTSESKHTARFVCTTDEDMAQIATFYAGAMSEARAIELGPIAERVGGLDLVLVGANDPEAMLRHTRECRSRGIPFAADPSQQLAFADGATIRQLIDGADFLLTNEYEAALTEQKTGWSAEEIADRVHTRVITRGKDGVTIERKGEDPDRGVGGPRGPPRRPDRGGRRVPRRFPHRSRGRPGAAALRRARVDAGDLRHRDGGHAGVHPRQGELPAAPVRRLRRRSRPTPSNPHIACVAP